MIWDRTQAHAQGTLPLVSVVMVHDVAADLLPVALESFRSQSYPCLELTVIGDTSTPLDHERAVTAVGGRLFRVRTGTPRGTGLNLGLEASSGSLCWIQNAAAWYGPDFLVSMVASLRHDWDKTYRPAVAGLAPFLLLDLDAWIVRQAGDGQLADGSMVFQREDWERTPFRPVDAGVGRAFVADQYREGIAPLASTAVETHLALRDGAFEADAYGETSPPPYGFGMPESILPDWALRTYRHVNAIRVAAAPA